MARSAKFWDRVADRYSKKPVADEASYRKKLEVTRRYLRPSMQVLEFGCGTGSTAIAHAPCVRHIRATDISSRMIEIARDKAKRARIDNVTFEQATIEELEVADRSVDAVLALNLLHLLRNPDAVIARVHAMLRPGGVFISSTACLGDFMPWFRFVGPLGAFFGVMPYVNVFTRKDLEASLRAAGFEIDHAWQPDRKAAVFIVAKNKA